MAGSPPQVRGKLITQNRATAKKRITPAGAGKTIMLALALHIHQDHPRRCGENRPIQRFSRFHPGSPPQVRGKLDMELFQAHYDRITPAGAGKTIPAQCTAGIAEDHPRRCGENYAPAGNVCLTEGSPPQVRGKPQCLRAKC